MLSVGPPAFTFVLVFIGFLPFGYDHRLSDGPSSLNPAFKFVLVLIAFLLSDLPKAVRMPIGNTPNGIAPNRPEAIGRRGDQGSGTRRWNQAAVIRQLPGTIRKDSLGLNG